MRRQQTAALVIALVVCTLLVSPLVSADPPPMWGLLPYQYPVLLNQLTNSGFEGPFTTRVDPYSDEWAGELELGQGWEVWYDNRQACPEYDPDCDTNSYNRRPEYKREEGTVKVRSGDTAQKFFTTYGTHTAGFYQTVDVTPGSWVRFSIHAWAWSSNHDDPLHSFDDGAYHLSVGIDPTGGTDWTSDDILWGEPVVQHDQWVRVEVVAYTSAGQISVWTRGAQTWPVKHNDSYWDDADLEVLDRAPTPTATPTATATAHPTIAPTPPGYEPEPCRMWRPIREEDFEGEVLDDWAVDPGEGRIVLQDGLLALRNDEGYAPSFPLVWSEWGWPADEKLRLTLRFAYDNLTGYGTGIGVGSRAYDGERNLAGEPDPEGIGDIVAVHQRMTVPGQGAFSIKLLGETVWTGTPGDTAWHELDLQRLDTTYILYLDGEEIGRGMSYLRPASLHLGNPVVLWQPGSWSELLLDRVTLEGCGARLDLPLLYQAWAFSPTATPTATGTAPATIVAPTPEGTLPPGPTPTEEGQRLPMLPRHSRPGR